MNLSANWSVEVKKRCAARYCDEKRAQDYVINGKALIL